jgi:hypothetical protein
MELINMKYTRLIALVLSLLTCLPAVAQTKQEADSELTRDAKKAVAHELMQAHGVADQFVKRFRETRDLTPLLSEMFTADFWRLIEDDSSWSGSVGAERPIVENLKGKDRIRCFVVSFTLDYLLRLFLAGKVPWDSPRQLREVWTPEMERYFRDENHPNGMIGNAEQARRYLAYLEQGLVIMQNEVRKNPPEVTEQFKMNLVNFEKHLSQYEGERPGVWISQRPEHGRPPGTFFAKFILPFHVGLLMVKENGQYKIWFALSTLPPD